MDLSVTAGSNKVRKGSVCSHLTLIMGIQKLTGVQEQCERTTTTTKTHQNAMRTNKLNWKHKELNMQENESTKQVSETGD